MALRLWVEVWYCLLWESPATAAGWRKTFSSLPATPRALRGGTWGVGVGMGRAPLMVPRR